MPTTTLTLKDSKTGKSKKVPWDKDRDPTDEELEVLMSMPESKPSILMDIWNKANAPTVDWGEKAGSKLGEPLLKYSESNPEGIKTKAARYAGAFANTFGAGLDTLSSPLNLALTAVTMGGNLAVGQSGRAINSVDDAQRALFSARMAGRTDEAERIAKELISARASLGKSSAIAKTGNAAAKVAGGTQAAIAAEEGWRKKDIKQLIPLALGLLGTRTGKVPDMPEVLEIPKSAGREHGPFPLGPTHGPMEQSSFERLSRNPETPRVNWDREQQQGLDLEFDNKQLQLPLKVRDRSAGMTGDKPEIRAFEALVPERYKQKGDELGIEMDRPNIEPRQPELFDPINGPFIDQTITPSALEPRLLDTNRPQWTSVAQQRQLPFDIDVIQKAETNPIPEIAKAAKQVVEDGTVKFSRKTGYAAPQKNTPKVRDDFFKSNYTRLIQDSPAGAKIARLLDIYRTEVGRTSGKISAAIKGVIDPLTPSQYAEFQRRLDSGDSIPVKETTTVENPEIGLPPNVNPDMRNKPGISNLEMFGLSKSLLDEGLNTSSLPKPVSMDTIPHEFSIRPSEMDLARVEQSRDPMVQLALDTVRAIDKDFTARAVASGLHLKTSTGEIVPFLGKENYWPRMYDQSLFADKPALIARLIKSGMSSDAANNAVNNARRFGERLIDPQHQRVLDLPEHRKDIGALLKHYDDMAFRVVAAEKLGVKDIADPNTPISQLLAGTKDTVTADKILRQYLDREGGVAPHEADFVKSVSKFTTAFYLSKFAISNSNQLAFVPVITNFSSTAKALGSFIKSPKKAWREAEAMGALQTVSQEAIRNLGGEGILSKVYLIKASEGSNRTISALAGKYYIQDLFKKAQKGNVRAQKSIEDLTLANWDDIKGQPTLDEKQIAYGATRVVEKTQGRAQSIDLPYNWDRSPYVNLLLLYKKYAFIQGRLLKDAIKTNPTRNVPLLLGLFQLAGETTGDAKAAIKGSITGEPGEEIANRGEHLGTGSMVTNRILQNYIDSMFLGLIGDAVQSYNSGKTGMYSFLGGPVASLGVETLANTKIDIANADKYLSGARPLTKSATARGLAARIPYIGTAVANKMKDTKIH